MKNLKFKPGDRVMVGPLKYTILYYDKVSSNIIGKPHYRCRLINRRCEDSYAEDKMIKI